MLAPLLIFGAASLVTGLAGFGIGMMTMGILPYFIGFRTANVMITIVSLVMLAVVLWPIRKHLRVREMLPVLLGLALGIPFGVFLLARVDESVMKRVLGGFILAYVGYEIFLRKRVAFDVPRRLGYLLGFVGGAFGGAFSTGAPPAVAYINSRRWDKNTCKANIALYLIVLGCYKVPFLFAGRLVSVGELPRILLFLVPGLIGSLGGMYLFSRISTRAFRVVVYVLLAASSLLLLVRG